MKRSMTACVTLLLAFALQANTVWAGETMGDTRQVHDKIRTAAKRYFEKKHGVSGRYSVRLQRAEFHGAQAPRIEHHYALLTYRMTTKAAKKAKIDPAKRPEVSVIMTHKGVSLDPKLIAEMQSVADRDRKAWNDKGQQWPPPENADQTSAFPAEL